MYTVYIQYNYHNEMKPLNHDQIRLLPFHKKSHSNVNLWNPNSQNLIQIHLILVNNVQSKLL